ncbi:zinc-finger domain-containing protein [Methylobacterium brachythecii]|uniref:Putative Zn-finger protein n=1 Tax=Methylobacterium brachythecii TaxID=1176177 RepID=A0A7W6AGA6_9HYPH|nr:zinc-finger domain-containing protein [Methylobacterium brachythecii]MBB3902785.1 putative Zn-finger protein [Methylobacterium brachythecii]GLS43710.1 hypothetical protein GCM10007884_16950 [Methylobacterium brachythecii]
MADKAVPHFHNQDGVPRVRVGAREFMCIGALPPFDHPHVFLDMGHGGDEIICQYCSTLFVYDARLKPDGAEPAASIWRDDAPQSRVAAE